MKKGARLEKLVQDSCRLQGILCERLKDGNSRTGLDGKIIRLKTSNPADFYVFTGKIFAYVEAKSYTTSVPFADLRQLDIQIEMCGIYKYLKAGFVIEFKKSGRYYWVDCLGIAYMKSIIGKKSFNEGDIKRFEAVSKARSINTYLPPRKRLKRLDMRFLDKI